jgi:hypothetical protein
MSIWFLIALQWVMIVVCTVLAELVLQRRVKS